MAEKQSRPIPNEPGEPPPDNGEYRRNGTRRAPLYDRATEEALLGAALYRADAPAAVAGLEPDVFSGGHAHIATAIGDLHRADQHIDPRTVAHWLATHDLLDAAGGPAHLIELQAGAPAGIHPGRYAELLAQKAACRVVLAAFGEATTDLHAGRLDAALARIDAAREATRCRAGRRATPTLREFLDFDEPDFDWVIPDLVERTDRVFVTGGEGKGKSTLLRQIAVQAAAGVHPFTLEPIGPLRVLLLDLENSRRQVRRKIRGLHIAAKHGASDNLAVEVIPEGLDLLEGPDARTLEEVIGDNHPDLLVGGPIYKLVGGDPTAEEPAKAAAQLLDRLRVRHGFALILEAHSPHDVGGRKVERPYGASLWRRWPEFGVYLADDGALRHWRGQRDERDWPPMLRRGGTWPWTPTTDAKAVTFARILNEVRQAGRRLTERELVDATGASKGTIHRCIEANQTQFDTVCEELET